MPNRAIDAMVIDVEIGRYWEATKREMLAKAFSYLGSLLNEAPADNGEHILDYLAYRPLWSIRNASPGYWERPARRF